MSTVVNPLTGRRIRANGATAKIPAVRSRLVMRRTARGTSLTGTKGFPLAVGSKVQVWNGTAHHTSGGVTRSGLIMVDGRIRFRSKSLAAKRNPVLQSYAQAAKRNPSFIASQRRRR